MAIANYYVNCNDSLQVVTNMIELSGQIVVVVKNFSRCMFDEICFVCKI